MSEDAQKLLMMFIKDSYSGSGKVSRGTAIEMMRYVNKDDELQALVNIGDNKSLLAYRTTKQKLTRGV